MLTKQESRRLLIAIVFGVLLLLSFAAYLVEVALEK